MVPLSAEPVQGAVVSLGVIGAGTNNARIAGMLRNLSSYYYKDQTLLFCVRPESMEPPFKTWPIRWPLLSCGSLRAPSKKGAVSHNQSVEHLH